MKQIPWEFFAQRRNISYVSFKNMSYEQYTRWCGRRNIIPLEENAFHSKVSSHPVTQKKPAPPQVEQKITKIDATSLSKKKKAELVSLCESANVEITGKETKKQLVALLIEQSN